jgi:hypothetical protein
MKGDFGKRKKLKNSSNLVKHNRQYENTCYENQQTFPWVVALGTTLSKSHKSRIEFLK